MRDIIQTFGPAVSILSVIATWYIHRRNTFRTATGQFRAAFTYTLARLRSSKPFAPGDTEALLREAFSGQLNAVTAFRDYLSGGDLAGFDKAWEQYWKHSQSEELCPEELPCFDEMTHLTEYLATNNDEEKEMRSLAIQRLEKVLSFAPAF